METLLPIDTEVEVLKLGPQNSPYTKKTGRVIGHSIDGLLHVILDEDPIPRWRDLGILCYPWEVRSIDDCE
jgi:hypothetical protein